MSNWILLVLAAVLNIGTVYFAKASEGMTRLWPTLGVVVTILLTQFLVARVMSSGGQVAAAADAMTDTDEMKAFLRNVHALKRIAAPEEQARAALFLASDAATFITGSAMLVDGGLSINKT